MYSLKEAAKKKFSGRATKRGRGKGLATMKKDFFLMCLLSSRVLMALPLKKNDFFGGFLNIKR